MSKFLASPRSNTPPNWQVHAGACLGISIGNQSEQGTKLQAIIAWMNENFSNAIIGLSDTLYRWNDYTISGTLHPDGWAHSLKKGDDWLKQNSETIAELTIPYKIIRWDYWLNHPEFSEQLLALKKLYDNDKLFRQAVDYDIDYFLHRSQKSAHIAVKKNCLSFILEELAAYGLLFNENPDTIKLYPGGDGLRSDAYLRENACPSLPISLRGIQRVSLKLQPLHTAISSVADKNYPQPVLRPE